ncbi:hypothetical protein ACF1BQ_020490 [Bradyrhizobium sp. RDT10]
MQVDGSEPFEFIPGEAVLSARILVRAPSNRRQSSANQQVVKPSQTLIATTLKIASQTMIPYVEISASLLEATILDPGD